MIQVSVEELRSSHKCRLGLLLVVLGDLYLLAAVGGVFERLLVGDHLLELLLDVSFGLGCDLIGTLGDDTYRLVHIARLLPDLGHRASDGGAWGLVFLLFHDWYDVQIKLIYEQKVLSRLFWTEPCLSGS